MEISGRFATFYVFLCPTSRSLIYEKTQKVITIGDKRFLPDYDDMLCKLQYVCTVNPLQQCFCSASATKKQQHTRTQADRSGMGTGSILNRTGMGVGVILPGVDGTGFLFYF